MAGFAVSDESSAEDSSEIMSGINITPFVDVVLVLLVIFMVTAPMLLKEVMELRLPKTATSDGQVTQTFGVAINREGNILLNGSVLEDSAFMAKIKESLIANSDLQAIIAADKEVPYGRVVKIIDMMKSAGLNRFAVQIERENAPSGN